jgi:hypothetical protein
MKTQNLHLKSKTEGSVLVVTLGITVILSIFIASYLSMIKTQRFSVARAQAWNGALAVAEAGVEEALAELNEPLAFKSFAQPGNQWTVISGTGTIFKTNIYVGTDSFYNVYIYSQSNGVAPMADSTHPVIISTSIVSGPLSSPSLSRALRVQAQTSTKLVPNGAMVARTTIKVNGFNVTTDSYQSTNLTLFPGGVWNQANRRDHGDVSTISTNSGDVDLGNGKIHGTVHTPQNWTASSANIGSQGSVGDNAWVKPVNPTPGIEPGHAVNDATQVYPDASLPNGAIPLNAPIKNWFNPADGFTYKYVLTDGTFWKIDSLNGGIYVKGTNVNVYLTGANASIPSGNRIEIPNTTDANGNPYKMSMYVAATSFTVNGTGYVDDSGIAKNLQYYGLPSNQSLTLGGNGSIVSQIYAPEAAFSLGGGGSSAVYDFSGLCVVKSVNMNGHFNFHYDECSKDNLVLFGFTARSWDEL